MASVFPKDRSRNLPPKVFSSMPLRRSLPRRFQGGDLVEVASFAEGFYGSYYEATVVADLGKNNGYVVQYRTLVKDDFSGPLREVASTAEVRPRPPVPVAAEYRLGDVVDVFDNDGWWMGKITARVDGDKYSVYFPTTGDLMEYTMDRFRVHQVWENGKWIHDCKIVGN